jgi:hypothetical protein
MDTSTIPEAHTPASRTDSTPRADSSKAIRDSAMPHDGPTPMKPTRKPAGKTSSIRQLTSNEAHARDTSTLAKQGESVDTSLQATPTVQPHSAPNNPVVENSNSTSVGDALRTPLPLSSDPAPQLEQPPDVKAPDDSSGNIGATQPKPVTNKLKAADIHDEHMQLQPIIPNGSDNTTPTQQPATVRSAPDEAADQRISGDKLMYDSLIATYKLGRPKTLEGWMKDVETEFAGSYKQYESGRADITCAVFYWVCRKLKVLHPDQGCDSH